jgi:hypothetical protein
MSLSRLQLELCPETQGFFVAGNFLPLEPSFHVKTFVHLRRLGAHSMPACYDRAQPFLFSRRLRGFSMGASSYWNQFCLCVGRDLQEHQGASVWEAELPIRVFSTIAAACAGRTVAGVKATSTPNLNNRAEGMKNRYCRSCAVEVSRENMTQVALSGHSKLKTSRVKARISKALSDHAVANKWWSPSSLPVCLNEEFYIQKIQPQLKTVKVREITQALQVSPPYAAFIRSGRRRPHPRHWLALSRLVGCQRWLGSTVSR